MIILRAANLRKLHATGEGLLHASLAIHAGEVIGIRGPSGSGKSTLLSALSFLEPPDAGYLEIFGVGHNFDIVTRPKALRMKLPFLRQHQRHLHTIKWPRLTVVFQELYLWPNLTLAENIALAHDGRCDWGREAGRLLTTLQLDSAAHKYPHQCSLGQQQRCALIRALSVSPELLLLDEPTSALDPSIVRVFTKEIELRSQQGRATLIISHDRSLLDTLCHRQHELVGGTLST